MLWKVVPLMAIRKRKWLSNGQEKVGWIADFRDHTGTRQKKQFPTKAQAIEYLSKADSAMREGTFRKSAEKMTVEQVAKQYLEHLKGRYKRGENVTRHYLLCVHGYYRNYILAAKNTEPHPYATPFFDGIGGLKLSHVTKATVGDFRDRMRDAGVGVVTTRKVLNSLKAMFTFAIDRNWIAVNPALKVKVMGTRAEQEIEKREAPPKWLVRALLAEAREVKRPATRIKLVAAITLAVATGIRASEMKGLRWGHISFNKREITVETRIDAYGEEDGLTKSAAGHRTLPLGLDVIETLRAWKEVTAFPNHSDFVIPNKVGGPIAHDHLRKKLFYPLFDRLVAKFASDPSSFPEGPERYTWHELRHFAISTWIEQKLTIKTVMTWAGHSSIQMTMDRYGHLFKSDDDWKIMDAIGAEILAGSIASKGEQEI